MVEFPVLTKFSYTSAVRVKATDILRRLFFLFFFARLCLYQSANMVCRRTKFQFKTDKNTYYILICDCLIIYIPFSADLDGSRDILSEFQTVLDEYDSHPILIAEVDGSYAKTSKYYDMSNIPFNFGLINKVDRKGMTLAQGISKTVEEYLASVPKGETPNWVIGNHDNARVGSRLGKDNRHAMNTLALTLPGVATTYYGEEIGMLDGNITNPDDYRHKERTPMQWNKEQYAGE